MAKRSQPSTDIQDDPKAALGTDLVVADEDLDGMLEEYKSEMSPEVLRLLAELKNLDTPALNPIDADIAKSLGAQAGEDEGQDEAGPSASDLEGMAVPPMSSDPDTETIGLLNSMH